MKLYLENRTGHNILEYEQITRRVAAETLRVENIRFNAEISVCVVGNEEIQELNKQHRGIDAVTDCLSFPLLIKKPRNTRNRRGADHVSALGDIVICFDRAVIQAKELGHSIAREIGFLTAHSVLHLLGYDHENPHDEAIMIEKQNKILGNLELSRN